MADEKTDHGTDQGIEKRHTEIDEVKSFSGGQIKSVEPEVETTEHIHHYSGGDIIERTDTRITPWYWGVVIVSLVVIVFGIIFYVLPGLINPAMRGSEARAGNAAGGIGNYGNLSATMQSQMVSQEMTSPTFIDMHRLPLPAGQNLDQAISKGADVYQTYCIGCHGPNQDGNGVNSVSLDPKPRNLRDAPFMQAMSYQRIWTSVHKGVPGTAMPRWENTLNDTQFEDVIAYVFSLTAPKDATTGKFLTPTPAEIAGSAGAEGTAVPASASGVIGTGAEAAHTPGGAVPNVAPQAGTDRNMSAKDLLKAPITGPPSH
jgi:mono/diheme cytochrome c family protein